MMEANTRTCVGSLEMNIKNIIIDMFSEFTSHGMSLLVLQLEIVLRITEITFIDDDVNKYTVQWLFIVMNQ